MEALCLAWLGCIDTSVKQISPVLGMRLNDWLEGQTEDAKGESL